MKIAGGKQQRADPCGKGHPKGGREQLAASGYDPLRRSPKRARQKRIGRTEPLEAALNDSREPDDREDEHERKLKTRGEQLVGIPREDQHGGRGEAVINQAPAGQRVARAPRARP